MFIAYATEKPHMLRRSDMEGISSRLSNKARQMPAGRQAGRPAGA